MTGHWQVVFHAGQDRRKQSRNADKSAGASAERRDLGFALRGLASCTPKQLEASATGEAQRLDAALSRAAYLTLWLQCSGHEYGQLALDCCVHALR